MLAEILAIFFGAIFVAAFRWLLTVESTKSDAPKSEGSSSGIFSDSFGDGINPSTGLRMNGLLDSGGNAFGASRHYD